MSQRKAVVEARLEQAEGALALLGRARRLTEIAWMKADFTNEPLRGSLLDDLEELGRVLMKAQGKVVRWRLMILDDGSRE